MNYKNHNLKQEYLKQSVMTATPPELIVMLYDSCVKNLKLAEISLKERRDFSGANTHFLQAQKIIMELASCLDTSFELSAQLLGIYDFLLYAVRTMNTKKDIDMLPGVLDILTSLRDTWQTVAKTRFVHPPEVS